MPKSAAAEWFLRLFTTPDRAAAIAGDMSEEGRVSWFDLLRTAAALFFRNVSGTPFRLLLLILSGVVVRFAFLDLFGTLARFSNILRSEPWVFGACHFAVNHILITSLIGYMLVRFAKERDITACLVYVIVISALPLPPMVMSARALWDAHAVSAGHLALGMLLSEAVPAFFLLASGVYARKHFLTRA
jgi:hypothetical protein